MRGGRRKEGGKCFAVWRLGGLSWFLGYWYDSV